MNDLRHYYLYAKGHYERNENILHDLQKIHGRWCGIEPVDVSPKHIIYKLLELVQPYIDTKDLFIDFIDKMRLENRWTYGANGNDTFDMTIIKNCLSLLRFVHVKDFPYDLGKVDPTLLPLNKRSTLQEMKDETDI